MTAPIGVGVIGVGYWGPNLLRNFNNVSGAEARWAADLDEKRLHIFHRMERVSDGALVASGEQMLLHVNSRESRACAIRGEVKANLDRIYAGHRTLDAPADAGRSIGIRPRNG